MDETATKAKLADVKAELANLEARLTGHLTGRLIVIVGIFNAILFAALRLS